MPSRKKILALLVTGSVIIATTLVTISILNEDNEPLPIIDNERWLEDFQAFYDFIEGNYPYLWVKNRTHGYNWLDLKDEYENRISEATTDSEALDVFLDAVRALQNRHTYIVSPHNYDWYRSDLENMPSPIGDVFSEEVMAASENWDSIYDESVVRRYDCKFDALIVYEKGVYVIANSGSWEDQHGEDLTVIAVNGEPIDDAVKDCFESDYVDWDYYRDKPYLWRISPRNFGADAVFTIRNSTGHEADMAFETSSEYSGVPYSYPTNIYQTQVWEEESTAYLYMSTFLWSTIESHRNSIVSFLQQIEDYDYLIIDIRGNLGGNYASWIHPIVRPLIKETSIFQSYLAYRTDEYSDAYRTAVSITDLVPKNQFSYLPPEVDRDDFQVYNYQYTLTPTGEVDFDGSIILLTDHVLYSASEGFTRFCKQTGFATIYGTASGGDGIMEFPTFFCLPNSRIVITLTSALGLDETGHSSEEFRTQPDVFFESSFGNHSELIDYVRSQLT